MIVVTSTNGRDNYKKGGRHDRFDKEKRYRKDLKTS